MDHKTIVNVLFMKNRGILFWYYLNTVLCMSSNFCTETGKIWNIKINFLLVRSDILEA